MSCKIEPAIWSRDTGQRIPCFDRCQLYGCPISTKCTVNQGCVSFLEYGRHVGGNSVVVRTRPRAIPLAMITMRNQLMGFLCFPVISMGLRLAALRAEARSGVMSIRAQTARGLVSCSPRTF